MLHWLIFLAALCQAQDTVSDSERPSNCKPRSELPDCPTRTTPTYDANKCPECKVPECTCNTFAPIRECAEGEQPQMDGCCRSCVPPERCESQAEVEECKEKFKNDEISPCDAALTADERKECCPCYPPAPEDARPDPEGVCTAEAREKCKRFVDVCEDGALPFFPENYCCPSCSDPRDFCGFREIMECMAKTPECSATDKPDRLASAGTCCPPCKPPRPSCDPACADSHVCVWGANADRTGREAKCIEAATLRLRLKAKVTAARERLADLDEEKARHLLNECIRRFAEKRERVERVERYRDQLDNVIVTSVETEGEDRVVTVRIPRGPRDGADASQTRGRRLLAEDSAEQTLSDAVTEEMGDTTVEQESHTSAAHATAPVALISVVGLGALTLLV